MDEAPHRNNDRGAFLTPEGAGQLGTPDKCFIGPLKIILLIRRQRRGSRGRGCAGERFPAVFFESRRLAGAKPFYGERQFGEMILDALSYAHAITAGLTRDDTRLPYIQQASHYSARHEQQQSVERAHSAFRLSEAVARKAIIVENIGIVIVQKCDKQAGNAEPGVYPEPVLNAARQRAHEEI